MSQSVLITGGARRIGRALARGFAGRGFGVAIHYRRSRREAQALARAIAEAGGRACCLSADLAEAGAAAALVEAAAKQLGPLTCLVNNASLFVRDSLADLDEESWRAHLDVNCRAPILLAQAFARQLPERRAGVVINLLDQKVQRLTPHFFSYTISKSALWAATQVMAQALAPRIRVNGIGPGPVLPHAHQSREAFQRLVQSLPLGRAARPEEIWRAAAFILDTPSMTGQMIALDGGQHLGAARGSGR